jgi:hypothetical protein
VWGNFTSWLGIESPSLLDSEKLDYSSFIVVNVIMEHVDGCNDGKAKYDTVIIDC